MSVGGFMNNKIGTIIKKLRLSKELTQVELADKICSVKQLSRIEQNTSSPSAYLLSALSDRLGHELIEFLPFSDDDMGYELKLTFDHLSRLYHQDRHEEIRIYVRSSLLLNNTTNIRAIAERNWISGVISHYINVPYLVDADYYFDILKVRYDVVNYDDIFKYALSNLDYRILNGLIVCLLQESKVDQAKKLLELSIQHYENYYDHIKDSVYIRLIYNLARIYLDLNVDMAIDVASKGIKHAIKNGSLYYLADLYNIAGRGLYKLGKVEEGKDYLRNYIALRNIQDPAIDYEATVNHLKKKYEL